jgi:hypothetical protein
MVVVRLNEELLLENSVSVVDLGDDEVQGLGLRRTKAYTYWYDGEGNFCKTERDAVRDEELDILVGVEDYRVAKHLLNGLSLNSTEQVDIFPDGHIHNEQGEVGSCTRKSHKNEGKGEGEQFRWGREQKFTCGTWRYAECKHCGYRYWVKVPCNREYCPQCGKSNSLYHRKLYLQILGVLLRMWIVGGYVNYMVITCPEELREKWKDPDEMRKFMKSLSRKLKSLGLCPVLYRWHWAGDRGRRWYPHLNLVFPMGYIDKEKLEKLRRYLERKGIKIIYCKYTRSLKKIRHLARYISRPTWILQDEVSPERFKGFRKWGVWGKELLGIKGRIKPTFDDEKMEEFWLLLGALTYVIVYRNKEGRDVEELTELARKFLGVAREVVGEGVAGLEKWLKGRGDIVEKIRRIVEKVLKIKGWPGLRELAAFVVMNRRCIGCFQKLEWKWKKKPFITRDDRVYKLGWGVLVVVDKEVGDEEFPF